MLSRTQMQFDSCRFSLTPFPVRAASGPARCGPVPAAGTHSNGLALLSLLASSRLEAVFNPKLILFKKYSSTFRNCVMHSSQNCGSLVFWGDWPPRACGHSRRGRETQSVEMAGLQEAFFGCRSVPWN